MLSRIEKYLEPRLVRYATDAPLQTPSRFHGGNAFAGSPFSSSRRPHAFFQLINGATIMKFLSIGAALVALAALATPAAAQRVVTNPGYCAQFYPNANCQNYGPGNPYTGSYQRGDWERGYARMGRHHRAHRMHHHRRMHRMR
jgi:hypothetical protein